MILHANAALSRRQRERLVSLVFAGTTITAAALVAGCSRQTASKWVGRARRGEGLADRSSRPRRSPRRTPVLVEQAVLRARRELRLGPHPLGWAPRPRRLDRARDPQAQRLLTAARAARPRRDRPLRARAPGELVQVDVKTNRQAEPSGHRRPA
jgi:transposase-like protein